MQGIQDVHILDPVVTVCCVASVAFVNICQLSVHDWLLSEEAILLVILVLIIVSS
jgi:hypothetical protein